MSTTANTNTITIVFGVPYLKTLPGMLKVLELLFDFIGFICIVATFVSQRGDAFLAASVGGVIITGTLLLLYVTGVASKLSGALLYKLEFIFCVIWVIFYIVVASLVIDVRADGYIAGGVFGLLAMVAYLMDAIHKFKSAPLF